MIKQRLDLLRLFVWSYIPQRLPLGMTEFNTWSDKIITVAGAFADKDSMRYVISTQIMHLGQTKASIAPQYFISCLRKAAANQIAGAIFQEIKLKQQEEQIKAAAQSKSDATVESVANEPQR